MKYKNKYIYLIVSVSITGLIISILGGELYHNWKIQQPKRATSEWLNAIKDRNAKQASNLVIDERFKTKKQLQEFYKQDFSVDGLKEYQITGETYGNTKSEVTVTLNLANGSTVNQTLDVIKNGQKWYVYIPNPVNQVLKQGS